MEADYSNKINNIQNGNEIHHNKNEIKLDVVIETLIKIYCFENKIKELCNKEDNKTNYDSGAIAPRNLIERYKEIFQFKSLINQFNNPTTLKYINYLISIEDITCENKNEIIKKEEYISKIIDELNKGNEALMNKIKDNICLLSKLNKEKLNYKLVNSKKKQKRVFVDFSIINYDIFLLLIEQNISIENNFLYANYFISSYDILIVIQDFGDCSNNIICEVGKFNKKDQSINIEYLLDEDKIQGSTDLKELLKDIDISEIFQEISKLKNENDEIQFIDYNFDFSIYNKREISIINNFIKEKNESLINDENEKKLNEITKSKQNNDINLRSTKNDEDKINKIGEESDNIINEEEFKVLSKNREKLEENILKKSPNENSLNNEINSFNNNEIKLDVVLETLIRIDLFEKKIKELCSKEDNKTNNPNGIIAPRYLIEKYKEIFQFKSLINQFNSPIIVKYINNLTSIEDIKCENKNEINKRGEYISKIINELNKGNKALMNEIKDNIGLLSELNKEAKLNYKSINLKEKSKIVFFDFTIINYDIFLLLIQQNISIDNNFLFVDYFISSDDILILIKEFGDCSSNAICEVGKINKKDQSINIKYLLDDNKIRGSSEFKDLLKDIEISEIFQSISKTKNENDDIEFIEYNFDFPIDNRRKISIISSDRKEKDESLIIDENEKKLNEITTSKKNNDINLN